jgi:hypothetical protein
MNRAEKIKFVRNYPRGSIMRETAMHGNAVSCILSNHSNKHNISQWHIIKQHAKEKHDEHHSLIEA